MARSSPSVLPLEKALQLAIEKNPQWQAAKAQLGLNDAELIRARLRPNPSLVQDSGIAEKTYRLGLEQTFELGGKRARRLAVARSERDIVLQGLYGQLLNLRAQVRSAYCRLFDIRNRLAAFDDLRVTTERLLAIAQRREQLGDIPQVDVLQVEIAFLSLDNEREALLSEQRTASAALNALLNQPLDTPISVTTPTLGSLSGMAGGQEAMNLSDLIDEALVNRPERLQALREADLARKKRALARISRVPNLSLTAGPDWVTGNDGGVSVFVIANLELPVWNRQQAAFAEADALAALARFNRLAIENRVILEVTQAFHALRARQQQLSRYESLLMPKADQVLIKSRRAFEEGKTSVILPLNAQQAYIQTRLGYLRTLSELQEAVTELERALGAGL